MPTHVVKINRNWAFWAFCILAVSIRGNAETAAFGSPDPTTTPPAAEVPNSTIKPFSTKTTEQPAPQYNKPGDNPVGNGLEYGFDRKPKDGSIAKEISDSNQVAKTRALAAEATGDHIDDPATRDRFAKYLGTKEISVEQQKAYDEKRAKIQEYLSDHKTVEAWKELYQLAKLKSVDGGISWDLATRIASIWDAGSVTELLAKQNEQLKEDVDTASRSADMLSDDLRKKQIDYDRRMHELQPSAPQPQNNGGVPQAQPPGSQQTTAAPMPDSYAGKLELTEEYLATLEAKARMKLNEMKAQSVTDKAKADFAEHISSLYEHKRFREIILAADFYHSLFPDGEYPVSMAKQVDEAFTATNDVQNSIDVFNDKLAKGKLSAARDRLEEAFLADPLHPAVVSVPLAKKELVDDFLTDLQKMQNMIEARDFTNLEPLLAEIKRLAPDFDTTKANAIVNGVKLESQLRLGKAKLAAQQGDNKTALEEFQAAAETWPGNPELTDKANQFFNSQDLQKQSLLEFDRLVADDNYRMIFDKQLIFAPGLKDDPKRQDQLKNALEKYKKAETAIEKATYLKTNGDFCGAWETVQSAVRDLPSDLKLNSMLGELTGKASEFVAAINKAKDAEAKGDFGYSLSCFAVAQRTYPPSILANEAIDRISKQILRKG